jgi:hypothetical protein
VEIFVTRGLVPSSLCGNDTLHPILLAQIMDLYLKRFSVPECMSAGFLHVMNCHRMMEIDLYGKVERQMTVLGKATGVNLDHYYKLKPESGVYKGILPIRIPTLFSGM